MALLDIPICIFKKTWSGHHDYTLDNNQLEYEGQGRDTNDKYFQNKNIPIFVFESSNGSGYSFKGVGKVVSQHRFRVKNNAYPIIPKWIIQIDENPLLLQVWNRRLLAIHSTTNPRSKYVTKLSVFALVRENHYTPIKSDAWAKGQGIVPLKNY